MLEKLNRPIWVSSRYSQIFRRIIPAHLIETKEALDGEKYDLESELDFLHPRRKDGEWDMRYARNRKIL
jgi:hypothetical protein|tara:strand:+ start:175 stop:381 length:207 start_codon:yes stop_codon:yes gene_type:complete